MVCALKALGLHQRLKFKVARRPQARLILNLAGRLRCYRLNRGCSRNSYARGHGWRRNIWSKGMPVMKFGATMWFTEYAISPSELEVALEERGFESLTAVYSGSRSLILIYRSITSGSIRCVK